jgi:ABC-type transport system involved in multi-copper enzyme maturation permease subunit
MNELFHPTLIASLLRQRAQSPARVLLCLALWSLPLALIAVTRGATGLQPLSLGAAFAFILGAGVIGGEASAGVFQLLFARPVTRPAYVLSRWLGVAIAAAAVAAAQIAVGALLLTAFHAPVPWKDAGIQALEQALAAIGTTSVIVMFSSFLPAVGDVFAVVIGMAFAVTVNGAGQLMQKPWLARAGDELHRFFGPEFSWAAAFGGSSPSWFHIASYLSTVTLCLTLAIVMMNRREISYASE